VVHFRIRGNTLTFKAGPSLDAMTLQPGQWMLLNDFYLLVAGYVEGCSLPLLVLGEVWSFKLRLLLTMQT
jgi:hypothetical protein